MERLRAILLLCAGAFLVGCGAEDSPEGGTPTKAEFGQLAVNFVTAMERNELPQARKFASPGGREWLDAEIEFLEMILEKPESASETTERIAHVVEMGSELAVVEVAPEPAAEGEQTPPVLVVQIRPTDGRWGVDAVAPKGRELRPFATMVEETRRRIETAKKERIPHPELGPIVEAYFAAAGKLDAEAMEALMTPECVMREKEDPSAFTRRFLEGKIQMKKWHFHKHSVEGDTASQQVRSILNVEGGETDAEPFTFEFVKVDDGWVIAAIR